MSALTLHRLNAGNYVTDLAEPVGSYVVYAYRDPATDRRDGWMVCEWVLTDWGHRDLTSREWARTLADARAIVADYLAEPTK